MLAFSLTDAANVHMRVARLPQGPTLTFRVQRYSLVKWVNYRIVVWS
jgi:ribosome biogenesis protein SSF1/2